MNYTIPFISNNVPIFVHKYNNHPPAMINNVPKSINKRLSSVSSNKAVFKDTVKIHQEAIEKGGFDPKL